MSYNFKCYFKILDAVTGTRNIMHTVTAIDGESVAGETAGQIEDERSLPRV